MNFQDKKVLVRVDFNVPLNSEYKITDDTRIQAALPTIQQLLSNGNAVILMSHLGRPLKKLNEDGSVNVNKFTLRHIVAYLSEVLGRKVKFATDCGGESSKSLAADLKAGEVLLLENTRFYKGEKKGEEAFAKSLADLADYYVNDAFGTAHRAHASTTTVAQFFSKSEKSFGLLMDKELANGNKVLNSPARPLTAIVGGAKVSDKILLLERLLDFADNLIVGGGMAYTFMKAQGGTIGGSLCEEDKLDLANELLAKAKAKGVNLYLPVDSVVADNFAANANTKVQPSNAISDGWLGLDIGAQAVATFADVIKNSKTILWNGPMGVFEMEAFANGTKSIALAVADATANGAFSLVGGGDSVAAVKMMKLDEQVSFVSTGGGAMLEFLEGKTLPGVAAILD
ncbi:MAG: phosphoglycerate kinase [Saprospiraceae bacterium]|jgi:phosphoglycerate kinase